MARQPRQPRQDQSNDQHSEQETVRRRDEWLRRSLNTPPKPHKEVIKERRGELKRKERKKGE